MDSSTRLVFSPEEAAKMLGISRAKLYELVKSQLVPYRRIPGVAGIRFTRTDIDAILDSAHRPAAVA